ncbi:MAG: UDP-N-acetylenolpyruvoylglucosamine reductase [Dehalococcoidia bacterium]|nr:UDP-N-acetylenolpyruvoylglucosamine reductase [Dehalococcoidia bacterium]|tara:strand:- start:190 stop:1098 length:909 start_codon:yes stop_codon:yes gene_type:complete
MTALNRLAERLTNVGDIRRNELMSRHTTFGVGGPADLYVTVRSADALAEATRLAADADCEPFVLGSGSNIVVADGGIRGVVIDNRAREEKQEGLQVRIGSGASFAGFARKMCRTGLAGLAWAVGIPGTLGGAVFYNAGAYGGCLSDVLTRVRLLNLEDGTNWLDANDLELAYRSSAFKNGALARHTVLEVELTLSDGNAAALVAEASSYDQRRLAAQPRGRNAGSMFTNSPDSPAWKLIDSVGLRGERRGEAAISEQHTNFFMNLGKAKASDVLWLVEEAERRVFETHGIHLHREVGFVGAW